MPKTIKSIEEEFDKEFKDISHVGCDNRFPCATMQDDIKSFLRTSITDLLEGLKMEEISVLAFNGDRPSDYVEGNATGFNSAIQEINNKIKEIIGK